MHHSFIYDYINPYLEDFIFYYWTMSLEYLTFQASLAAGKARKSSRNDRDGNFVGPMWDKDHALYSAVLFRFK